MRWDRRLECTGIIHEQNKRTTFHLAESIDKKSVNPPVRVQSTMVKSHRLISFITDIEGCANYLDRFVNISKILKHQAVEPQFHPGDAYFPYDKQIAFDDEHGTSILVFGGDVWDRGGSDLYVIRQLLSLKRRYPDRVYFLMGNRDINKMRIPHEMRMGLTEKGTYQSHHPGVYWLRGTGLRGDPTLDYEKVESPAERLRWILSKTMGAPTAFDLRKNELQLERDTVDCHKGIITDEDVVRSYLRSCMPGSGEMGQYLSHANVALLMGGILFIHGALPIVQSTLAAYQEYKNLDHKALPSDNRKVMREKFWSKFFSIATPWTLSTNSIESNSKMDQLQSWVNLLNDFSKGQVNMWLDYFKPIYSAQSPPNLEPPWSRDGGYFFNQKDRANMHPGQIYSNYQFGSIMQYGMGWLPDKSKNPTVVYSSWFHDGMPRGFMMKSHDDIGSHNHYDHIVSDFFHDFKIDLIVGGHQPLGDLPFPIQVDSGKFILCADTSYSGDTHWTSHDSREPSKYGISATSSHSHCHGRGSSISCRGDVAVSEVLIEQCNQSGKVTNLTCHGVLSDGTAYSSVNFLLEPRIGKRFEQGTTSRSDWWVKSIFTDDRILLSKGSGYSVVNSFVNKNNNKCISL
jgi:hypothetical protein